MTDITPPARPVWKAHSFQAQHYLEWTHLAATDVEEFIIYRNTSATDVGAVEAARTSNLNILVDYNADGDWFGVQAVDYSGLNKSAIVWTSVAYDPTPASAPTVAANLAEFGGFQISWAAVTLAATYEVQGATDNTGTGAATKWSGAGLITPALIETGVSWFRVRAIGLDSSTGPWSAWETDDNAPPQPVLATTGDLHSVSVGLGASDTSHLAFGFSHYVLERADSNAGAGATTLDSHATYASFPRLFQQLTGLTKYFRLTPYDWAGNAGSLNTFSDGSPRALAIARQKSQPGLF